MLYTLIFVTAATVAPTYLGDYSDQQACQAAIRSIYSRRLYPAGQPKNPEIEKAIDITIQVQHQYVCVPK